MHTKAKDIFTLFIKSLFWVSIKGGGKSLISNAHVQLFVYIGSQNIRRQRL